ncbi:hypothetical protein H0A73_17265 [Alcaligenaceae bacterium]|nr:hypothetical protein [Alcaligenaceae bacterium]
MSKIQAPEPVAEVCSGHTLHWAGSGPIAPLCERTGAKVGSLLFTTEQAEAYAADRVREALENMIDIIELRSFWVTPKALAAQLREQIAREVSQGAK